MNATSDLPPELVTDLQDRQRTFQQAAGDIRLPADRAFSAAMARVFVCSDFVAKTCTQHPELLSELVASNDLYASYPQDHIREHLAELISKAQHPLTAKTLGALLRGFRRREMLRIAWRDLAGWCNLEAVMTDMTALAEACLQTTLDVLNENLCTRYGRPAAPDGTPQNLTVIGMGKLGAAELNFSSDIDLVFAYPQPGRTCGGPENIRNETFFLRLCRDLIQVIGARTAQGLVFRVDLNLRPYGENGPLCMHFDAMEDYYLRQGREWERYAWIKARAVAGDVPSGKCLLDTLRPFIYRRYLDFGAFDALREMKSRISQEVKRQRAHDNIKLGPGGIREIEFFAQMFQLIRGGVFHRLQERRLLTVLQILSQEQFIERQVAEALSRAYVFLRNTEHRLQEFADRQTHRLPAEPLDRARLAYAMGFPDWTDFSHCLKTHMQTVHRNFSQLLEDKESSRKPHDIQKTRPAKLSHTWRADIPAAEMQAQLQQLGFDDAVEIARLLYNLRHDRIMRDLSPAARRRLDRLIPLVLETIHNRPRSDATLGHIIDLLKAVLRRSSYLALLAENPSTLQHLVRLTESSAWIVALLTRYPVLLDELLDPRTLYTPASRTALDNEIRNRLAGIDPFDLEQQLETLVVFKQAGVLRVAAADISGHLPLMKTSDHLTDIAEVVVSRALELAWRHLVRRHGRPDCLTTLGKGQTCFAVIAYGKLGGIELGYGSDLDLVFLHAGDRGRTDGPQAIDNTQFYTRLGQRMVHILTTRSRAGGLYETDMRLRPSGSSGLLVSHVNSFEQYQLEKAWTWEHQAIVRARAIAGDRQLGKRFAEIRAKVLTRPRDPAKLRREILDMRERMRREHLKPVAGTFDLKQGHGGIVDIEFLVQYLVLRHARDHIGLQRWTDNVRLLQTLMETRALSPQTAHFLRETYLTCRQTVHRLNLQQKPAQVTHHTVSERCRRVWQIWQRYLAR